MVRASPTFKKSVIIAGLFLAAQLAATAFGSELSQPRGDVASADYKVRKIWNFTPADYTKLKASGGELTFSERSRWVPALLQESILGVLKFVLDENLKPSSTAGVNRLDFYHGHLNCVSPNVSLQKLAKKFEAEKERAFERVGLKWFNDPTTESFKTWASVTDRLDRFAGKILRDMIRNGDCTNALVQYHTFEYNNEQHGVAVNDRRRHLSMRLGDEKLTVLRETAAAQSDLVEFKLDLWAEEKPLSYFNMFNFGFLIDPSGVIHVTEGSQLGLHRFTGVRD